VIIAAIDAVCCKEGVDNGFFGRFDHGGKERVDRWILLVDYGHSVRKGSGIMGNTLSRARARSTGVRSAIKSVSPSTALQSYPSIPYHILARARCEQ